jgi:hypothetical protein
MAQRETVAEFLGAAAMLSGRRPDVDLDDLTPGQVLRLLQALRLRHAAVVALIAALEGARDAGCDLSYMQCLGCSGAGRVPVKLPPLPAAVGRPPGRRCALVPPLKRVER